MSEVADTLNDLAKQAGFLAAHAIWCVSEGDTLVPFVGSELEGGDQHLDRYLDETELENAVKRARESFIKNERGALLATLVYDGYVTLSDGKTDALLLESRAYCNPPLVIEMAVPYRHAEHSDGFAVFRSKFINASTPEPPDYDALGSALFAGVDAHEQGAAIWSNCLDESR